MQAEGSKLHELCLSRIRRMAWHGMVRVRTDEVRVCQWSEFKVCNHVDFFTELEWVILLLLLRCFICHRRKGSARLANVDATPNKRNMCYPHAVVSSWFLGWTVLHQSETI